MGRIEGLRLATLVTMCIETSRKDASYNCIAWALGFSHLRLWPSQDKTFLWPRPKPNVVTVQEFAEVFALFGYQPSAIGFEPGYEKIALYVADRSPEHAARQLPDTGKWTAKLGGGVDVQQDHLRDFPNYPPYGGLAVYGKPTFYYKRKAGSAYPSFEEVAECHGVWPLPPRIISVYEAAS
jgi:hypothetical protein